MRSILHCHARNMHVTTLQGTSLLDRRHSEVQVPHGVQLPLRCVLPLLMQAAKQRDAAKRKREREEKAKEKKAAKKARAGGGKAAKATPAKAAKVQCTFAHIMHLKCMSDAHKCATLQAEVQQLVTSVLQTATKKRKQREEGACA